MRAGGHDDGAAGNFKVRAALGERHVKLADVALDAGDFGFEVGLDVRMFLDLVNEAAGEGGDVVVLEGVVNIVQGPAQTVGSARPDGR